MFGFSGFGEFAFSEFPDIEEQSSGTVQIQEIATEPTFAGSVETAPAIEAYIRVEPEV